MQRKDVERVKAEALTREDEYGEAWVLASDYAELLDRAERAEAERDAAFAAGQEEMRERAAKAYDAGMAWDTFGAFTRCLCALPIKPRP